MHPPSRARRIVKWTGLVACSFIAALWSFSIFFAIEIPVGSESVVRIMWGSVIAEGGPRIASRARLASIDGLVWQGLGVITWDAWTFNSWPSPYNYYFCMLAIWVPFALTAIPTAWLWHRDRRLIRPGHCPGCGYDLTGNTSGVCPECGDKACPPTLLADSECRLPAAPTHEVSGH